MKILFRNFAYAQIFVLFFCNIVFAQVITTDPAIPIHDQPLTIYLNTNAAGAEELAGYTGDIYAHTGVNNWQYVIGDWNVNASQPKLTRVSDTQYKLEIATSIRQFYSVPGSIEITRIAIVFRSADRSKQTRPDIFIDVYEAGLNVSFVEPAQKSNLIEFGENLTIRAAANEATSLSLFIDDTQVATTNEEEVSYVFSSTTYGYGSYWAIAVATDGEETVKDSVSLFVRSEPAVADLPAGVIPGINYLDDNTVTLVLHDPPAAKQFAFVIGDFNNWLVTDDTYMNRTPSGEHFWITITGLEAGKEYGFQYYIDGELRIADPYTEKVLDPWHDKWIPESTYPSLIPYPEDKTTGLAAVLQTAQTPYEWETTDFTSPAAEDLVIYELLIRDFVETRDIKTLTDTLDYLARLGVNAIGLMPVNEFEGNDSWGYNPSFYFATDKAYGRKQDYKRFIDECHRRGIAVILDMVLNHSFGQSPLLQMYFDSSAGQWGQPLAANPWYNQICPHEPWCWGYDFDHLSPYTQEFVDRVNAYWLTEFRFDGFRFDFTKGFTNQQTGNQGSNYDAVRVALLKRMADKIWEINPDAYVILEHFCDNTEEKELAEYGMMLWGNINYSYNEATMGWLPGSNFSGISYQQRNWSVPHLVGYMESHDEERLMFKNVTYGNSGNPAHNIKDTTIALQRNATAAAFFFTIPGPKMIWQFGELGYGYSINHCPDGTINDGCRTSPKPVRWDYYEDESRKQLFDVYSQLIALKKYYDVFRTTDYNLSLGGAMKRIRLNHNTMNAVVIGNFGIQDGQASPQFQSTGWWYEYFSGDSLNVIDINMTISLEPAEYRLYTSKNVVGINEKFPSGHSSDNILIVAPNPVEDHFTVHFTISGNDYIALDIYNLQGIRVASLFEGEYNRGRHSISQARPANLTSGLYMLRMSTGSRVTTQKFVVP